MGEDLCFLATRTVRVFDTYVEFACEAEARSLCGDDGVVVGWLVDVPVADRLLGIDPGAWGAFLAAKSRQVWRLPKELLAEVNQRSAS